MKKTIKLLPVLLIALIISSCSSVRVASDYDKETEFKKYKTFAFFKPGIDKAEISDIDKRRILKACLLYTSPSPRDRTRSRMPSSA